jgi:hypothetical protein
MSNVRKSKTTTTVKNDLLKNESARPAVVKAAPAKPVSPAAIKTAPAQPTAVKPAPAPVATPRPAPAPVAAPKPAPASVQAALAQVAPVKPAPTIPEAPKGGHVFLELVKPDAKKVFVAGSFNEWKPEKTPLVLKGNGRWVGDLTIKPGRHEYLFVVDGQWLPDPNAKESVQNPFGGRNSILTVSA